MIGSGLVGLKEERVCTESRRSTNGGRLDHQQHALQEGE